MVKAINIEGEVKCESLLNILPSINNIPINNEQINIQSNGFPPEFLQLFTDQQTLINSTIKFEARLIGTQPLNVKKKKNKILLLISIFLFFQIYWLFNGSPISNNQRYQQQVFNDTYSLTIYDIRYEDAGRYTLNAENAWGKATCTSELFVPPTPMPGKIFLLFV
jgi:hypothetical protein